MTAKARDERAVIQSVTDIVALLFVVVGLSGGREEKCQGSRVFVSFWESIHDNAITLVPCTGQALDAKSLVCGHK